MGDDDKTERFNLRISKSEAKMLDKLAAKQGLTESDVLRALIRGAFAKTFPDDRVPFETAAEKFERQVFESKPMGKR